MWYWQVKSFKTLEAQEKWVAAREGKIEWQQLFVDNGYAIEWRSLRIIG